MAFIPAGLTHALGKERHWGGSEGFSHNHFSKEPGLEFVSTSPGVLLISSCPKLQPQTFQFLNLNVPWGPQLYLIRTIIRNLKFTELVRTYLYLVLSKALKDGNEH